MSAHQKPFMPVAAKAKICKLNKDGNMEEIDRLSVQPIVFCSKCRAKADNPSNLCNPRSLELKRRSTPKR